MNKLLKKKMNGSMREEVMEDKFGSLSVLKIQNLSHICVPLDSLIF